MDFWISKWISELQSGFLNTFSEQDTKDTVVSSSYSTVARNFSLQTIQSPRVQCSYGDSYDGWSDTRQALAGPT